jgi:NAD(P)-dependent dehydrogenase (short-subunit alcohol dehydrogenase family)
MAAQNIEGSVALVTGANRGIGRSIVEALLARGAAKVYAGSRNPAGVADLVAAHPERVIGLELDVTDAAEVAAAAAVAGDVTLLVNNAGVATGFGLSLTDPAVMDGATTEMDVNYFGLLRVTQAFAPALAANGGGSIVNLSSVVGLTAFAPFVSYSASKAAVRSLIQSARVSLAGQGTQIIGVYPGPIDTDMAADLPFDKTSPEHVANAILDGVESGADDVYPDPFSQDFGSRFEESPAGLEEYVTAMVTSGAPA